MTMEQVIWTGIVLCLVQSGLFSGLNLALLGLSRLQLEVEANSGNPRAQRILDLRKDSNFLLTTVLWGNVAVNCLLTLLSDSVMLGIGAFLFSTFGITIVGEILPQAYFSRNAMIVGSRLVPFVRFYQKLLYPVAKPTALFLDAWLGAEEVSYFRERELQDIIRHHMQAEDAELKRREGMGALNFFALDDLSVSEEGVPVDPASVIPLPVKLDLPIFPPFSNDRDDAFLRSVQASGKKWIVITDPDGTPRVVLDADGFLRDAFFSDTAPDPYAYCHRPVVVKNPSTTIGAVIRQLRVDPEDREDDVIDHDLILVWTDAPRVITGADLLGRIMRGIVSRGPTRKEAASAAGALPPGVPAA